MNHSGHTMSNVFVHMNGAYESAVTKKEEAELLTLCFFLHSRPLYGLHMVLTDFADVSLTLPQSAEVGGFFPQKC